MECTDGETEDFNAHECRKYGLGLTTEEQAEAAFVCGDDSLDSPSLNYDSSDSTTEEDGSETDGSETEERRARASAASELQSPRVTTSKRVTRQPAKYGVRTGRLADTQTKHAQCNNGRRGSGKGGSPKLTR